MIEMELLSFFFEAFVLMKPQSVRDLTFRTLDLGKADNKRMTIYLRPELWRLVPRVITEADLFKKNSLQMVIMDNIRDGDICDDDCFCLLLLIFSISIAVIMIRMVVLTMVVVMMVVTTSMEIVNLLPVLLFSPHLLPVAHLFRLLRR